MIKMNNQARIEKKGIKFTETDKKEEIANLGFKNFPVLKVNDKFMEFYDANKWINDI
jgi:hypothetical protein